jgi:uncharacterized protein (DUF1330 family)
MLFIREGAIRDQSAMELYRQMNRAGRPDPNITPLVVYGAIEAMEGEAPDGIVILQFPTVEAAKAWYTGPEYQAALPHRTRAADYRALIVQGI